MLTKTNSVDLKKMFYNFSNSAAGSFFFFYVHVFYLPCQCPLQRNRIYSIDNPAQLIYTFSITDHLRF